MNGVGNYANRGNLPQISSIFPIMFRRMEDKLQQIIELLRENNSMLREIVGYVRKVDSSEYDIQTDIKAFCINIIADVVADGLLEENDEMINNIKQNFKLK